MTLALCLLCILATAAIAWWVFCRPVRSAHLRAVRERDAIRASRDRWQEWHRQRLMQVNQLDHSLVALTGRCGAAIARAEQAENRERQMRRMLAEAERKLAKFERALGAKGQFIRKAG